MQNKLNQILYIALMDCEINNLKTDFDAFVSVNTC